MESKHLRKLLQLYQACSSDPELATTVQNATSSSSTSPQPPPTLDSSMALTIFVLLIVLFFLGFFSVYIRHFADESTADISSIPRRRSSTMSPRHLSPSVVSRPFSSRRGLDSQVNPSLWFYICRFTLNQQNYDIAGRSIFAGVQLHESREAAERRLCYLFERL